MKRKLKDLGKRITSAFMGLVMAGSGVFGGVTIPAQAASTIVFDSNKFITQAMTHLGDGYDQHNRMGAGITDCTSFIYKVLKECGFDGGSGIYAADNTIPSSTSDWINDIANNALQIKDSSGNYVEVVYADSYENYKTMKDNTALYGGKLLVCKQSVNTDTLATEELPAGTIVVTQAKEGSPAHAQIILGKPGTNGLPAAFTATDGDSYYNKLTTYMNSFFYSLNSMYGLTQAQINKMVVIPADGNMSAVITQNAGGGWKYADWGYFNENSFTTRREDAIACLIDGDIPTNLKNINWVIDSASSTYGTRLRMGISGKAGGAVSAYLVTPVEQPKSTTFTVKKSGTAVENKMIKSVTFKLYADGTDNVLYSDDTKMPTDERSVTLDLNYSSDIKSYTWQDLKKYNSDGSLISYTADEIKVVYKDASGVERTATPTSDPTIEQVFSQSKRSTTDENGKTQTISNSFRTLLGRFAIQKIDDEHNPVGATFYVYSASTCKADEKIGQFTCSTITATGGWTTTWSSSAGQSKTVYFKEYDEDNDGYITVNGKQYRVDTDVHTVVMPGYTDPSQLGTAKWTIDGVEGTATIENDETTSHSVQKKLNGDAANYVTSIDVQLYRNVNGGTGSKVGNVISLKADGSYNGDTKLGSTPWSYDWKSVLKYDENNKEYHYYAVETAVSYKTPSGATGTLTGDDITKYFTTTTDNAANATTIKAKTTLTNELIKIYGAVQIEKVNAENKTVKLPGVEYAVYSTYGGGVLSGKIGDNIVTGDDGIATYTVSGTWYKLDGVSKTVYIQEQKTIQPYVIDRSVYTVVITGSAVDKAHSWVKVTSPENVSVSYNDDGTKICLYHQDNTEKYGQITVKKTGEVLTGFTPGNTEGAVEEYTNGTFTYEQRAMAGATFELRTAQAISNKAGTVGYAADQLIDTKTSGADGIAVFGTDHKLPMGTYKIIETAAPSGQTIPDVHEWTVTLTYDNYEAGVVSASKTVGNKLANASVSVIKVDADNGSPLEGTYFGLFSTDDIFNADNAKIVSKGQMVAVLSTDSKGEGTFNIDIPYGKYHVKELKTLENYTLSNEAYELTFSYVGNDRYESDVIRFTHTFENEQFKAKLRIIKIDAETGNQIALAGTEFKIRNLTTDEYVTYKTIDADTGEEVVKDIFTTNDQGYVITDIALPVGSYRIEEQTAPDGYYNSETAEGIQSTFEIKVDMGFVFGGSNVADFYDEENEVYTLPVEYYDTAVKGSIEVTKSGEVLSGYNAETGVFEYINRGLKGAVYEVYAEGTIYTADHHTDEEGNRDVAFNDSDLVGKITTGKSGKGSLSNLPLNEVDEEGNYLSRYKIIEVKAPDGYLIGKDEAAVHYAVLTYDGQNEKIVFDSDGVENHFHNDRPTYDISVYKYEKDAEGNTVYEKPLAGTSFLFKTNADIKNYKGEVIVTEDTVLASGLVTDESGRAAVPAELKIPYGSYAFVETGVTSGYVLDDTPANVNYSYKDQNTPVISVRAEKADDFTTVVVSKIDGSSAYKGTLIPGAHMELVSENGQIRYEWISEAGKPMVITRIPAGKYTLREISAPTDKGYVKAKDVSIVVEAIKDPQSFDMFDDHTKIELSKVDEDGNFVPGAVISLYLTDEAGNRTDNKLVVTLPDGSKIPATFTDTSQLLKLDYVPVGTYIMHEDVTPYGYVTANDITIVVIETCEVQTYEAMVDKPISLEISKISVAGSEEIEGAELAIYRAVPDEAGNMVSTGEVYVTPKGETCSWTSTHERHVIKYMEVGTYILHEVTAPTESGYVKVSDVVFTVADTGVMQQVQMVDEITRVSISKTLIDDDSAFIEGATLSIYRIKDGEREAEPVKTWITGTEPHNETQLAVGSYVLVEEKAPEGYALAEPVGFEVKETAEVQYVDMKDAEITQPIKKTDAVTGEEVFGAKLSVYHALETEDGEWIRGEILVIDEEEITWISAEEERVIRKIPAGEYILAEVTAPSEHGYVTANDIHFTVTNDKAVQEVVEMKDEHTEVHISKTDITTGEEVEGAELAIYAADENGAPTGDKLYGWTTDGSDYVIEYMPTGDYVLIETMPPYEQGYTTAESVRFTVEDTGEIQKVEMKDKKSTVSISKKDVTDQKELPGAKLILTDKDGKEIDSWISTTEEHVVTGLIPLEEYTLTEITAPDGYEVAESITFVVKDSMEVQTVTMYDKPTTPPSTPPSTPPILGIEDHSTMLGMIFLGLAGLAMLGAFMSLRKKKRT